MEETENLDFVNNDLQNSQINTQSAEESSEKEFSKNEAGETPDQGGEIDYAALVEEDLATLSKQFPELSGITDITELENPLRYAALRDLGLTPEEAYLASGRVRQAYDNRSHLNSSPRRLTPRAGVMSEGELEAARHIFSDLSDAQIRNLYRKVTK
jgi:hypothetical protein